MADPNADLSDGLVGIVFVNIIIVKGIACSSPGFFSMIFKVRVSPVILSKQSKKKTFNNPPQETDNVSDLFIKHSTRKSGRQEPFGSCRPDLTH